jgi:diguanylate cyclase (GGDEF) domain
MYLNGVKKLTYLVNTAILIMVFGLMMFFIFCKATFLIYFSIPTALVYVVGYMLIAKNKMYEYVVMVYSWITLYMGICTVCLGYDYGFHLYSMSMIPIIFYSYYLGYQIGSRKVNPYIFSAVIVVCYLVCTMYPFMKEPIYEADKNVARVFWITNSVVVFGFLIFYTGILIRTIVSSEERLKNMALIDNLTGLHNRHYMMTQLERAEELGKKAYVAMIDIDGFKGINDIYGHNAGDMILKSLADIMNENCPECEIARWGGEEFLILVTETEGNKPTDDYMRKLMDKLRMAVEAAKFTYEEKQIKFTVTVGVAQREDGLTIERWVDAADDKLYYGKNNGKNMVVM